MLKEAIEKIAELAGPKTYKDKDGNLWSDTMLDLLERPMDHPSKLVVNSLNSIVNLVQTEAINSFADDIPIYVHVASHNLVQVFTGYRDDYSRDWLYAGQADVPGFCKGYRDQEKALIELRSLFLPNEGVDYLLDLLSRMSNESKVTSIDNGVTQTVEAASGISLKANVAIKPRVTLQPFRTFLEVEQPASEFLLRINEHGEVGLFEADGGVWKLEAKNNIAAFLSAALADEIAAGRVVVMV